MKHKKQAYEQLVRTYNWNRIRGNTPVTLDWGLEIAMLQEELNELSEAIKNNNQVAIFDAILDIKFVLNGTEYKFGITPEISIAGYEAVLEANESKSSTKNAAGKITKPDDFVGPETKLQTILDKHNSL